MRIVTISDDVSCSTGFGVQHAMLAKALHDTGLYDVTAAGLWSGEGMHAHADGYHSVGLGEGGIEDLRHRWPEVMRFLAPDLVITWGDMRMFYRVAGDLDAQGKVIRWKKQGAFKWMHWYPVDSPTFEFAYKGMMELADLLVVPTMFGLRAIRPFVQFAPLSVIPCAVDVDTFVPVDAERRVELRRQWSEFFGDKVDLTQRRILLSVDTNQFRKDPYVAVRCMREMPDDVVLIMHCSPHGMPGSRGWRLDELAKIHGVEDRVLFTSHGEKRLSMSRRDLAQLYQIADVRISATEAEGFGVPTIEAAACGVPSVITACTTNPELLCGEERFLARVAHVHVQQSGNMERAKVDEADFVAKIRWHLDNPVESAAVLRPVRERLFKNFTIAKVSAAWCVEVAKLLEVRDAGKRSVQPASAAGLRQGQEDGEPDACPDPDDAQAKPKPSPVDPVGSAEAGTGGDRLGPCAIRTAGEYVGVVQE